MMGYIFSGMMIAAFLFGALTGRMEAVSQSVLDGARASIELSVSLLGMMCFWSGMLEVAKRASLTKKLARLILPLTKFLFPGLKPNSPAMEAISLNMTANFLGLSNAATPLGLAAMQELQKINPKKHIASDAMCMFVVINTASLTLVPTTVIAMRAAAGSEDAFCILVPVWICSVLALCVGVASAKLLARCKKGGAK